MHPVIGFHVASVHSILEGPAIVLSSRTPCGIPYHRMPLASAFRYGLPGKADKGVLRRFLVKVSGVSRAQPTRLIAQHRSTGRIDDRRGPPRRPFSRRYTAQDIRLLAQVDALHGTVSGPATRKLCERACTVFHDRRFERGLLPWTDRIGEAQPTRRDRCDGGPVEDTEPEGKGRRSAPFPLRVGSRFSR